MKDLGHKLLLLQRIAVCSWLTLLSKIETYFLHSPDPVTPIEETVEAMQEVYAAGGYKHVSHLRDENADVIFLLAANTL